MGVREAAAEQMGFRPGEASNGIDQNGDGLKVIRMITMTVITAVLFAVILKLFAVMGPFLFAVILPLFLSLGLQSDSDSI